MPTRRKRQKKKKKTQRGGTVPIFVDFKKGVNVTKDLINALKKPVDYRKAKAKSIRYKKEYQDYKRRGGSKSFGSWVLDKGYGKRSSSCSIM